MFCRKCGTFLNSDGTCPECGAHYELPRDGNPTAPAAAPQQANSMGQNGFYPSSLEAVQSATASVSGEKKNPGWMAWVIAIPALALLFFLIVCPLCLSFLLALKEYNPADGLFGSPFVGLQHFQELFAQLYFPRALSNSFFYGILTLLLGGAYVFGASYGVASVKNVWLKCGILSALLLPVFLPSALVARYLLPLDWMNQAGLYRFGPVLNELFCVAPITVLAGAFLHGSMPPVRRACFIAGCYACLHLILLFSPDISYILLSYCPLTYETADILDTFAYREGLQNFQYSVSAAVVIVKVLLQLLPAAIGTAGLLFFANKEKKQPLEQSKAGVGTAVAAVLGLAGIVVVIWIFTAFFTEMPLRSGASFWELGGGRSLMLAIGGGFFAAVVAVGLSCAMSNGGKISRAFMMCFGTVFLLGFQNDIGRYLHLGFDSFLHTDFGLMLQYGTIGVFGAYLLFVASEGQYSGTIKDWIRRILPAGVALTGVGFAKLFGDVVYYNLFHVLRGDNEKLVFGPALRSLLYKVWQGLFNQANVAMHAQVLIGCLLPIIVGIVCIWLGGWLQNRAKHRL